MKKSCFKLYLVTVISLSISIFANAQANIKNGFVVLSNGDTLKGQIDYRNWEVNPLYIQFQDNSGIKKFTPEDLTYFEIEGGDVYISRLVTKDMRLVNLTDVLTKFTTDTTVTEKVFLRELFPGKNISLYELRDFKPRFYIMRTGFDKPEELLYKIYPNANNTGIEERNIFRDQLTGIAYNLNASEKLVKKIGKLNYEKSHLLPIIAELNNEKKSVNTEVHKSKKQFNNQLLIGGGVQLASFSFSGDIEAYNSLKLENTVSPIIGLAYDAFSARGQQRLGLRFELNYSSLHLKGESTGKVMLSTVQRNYELSQTNITPGVGAFYHFISSSKIRVYAGLGISTSFSFYGDVKMVEKYDDGRTVEYDDIDPAKVWFSSKLFLGARIANKVNLGLSTKLTGDFYNRNGFYAKSPSVNITAAYILTSGKKTK